MPPEETTEQVETQETAETVETEQPTTESQEAGGQNEEWFEFDYRGQRQRVSPQEMTQLIDLAAYGQESLKKASETQKEDPEQPPKQDAGDDVGSRIDRIEKMLKDREAKDEQKERQRRIEEGARKISDEIEKYFKSDSFLSKIDKERPQTGQFLRNMAMQAMQVDRNMSTTTAAKLVKKEFGAALQGMNREWVEGKIQTSKERVEPAGGGTTGGGGKATLKDIRRAAVQSVLAMQKERS